MQSLTEFLAILMLSRIHVPIAEFTPCKHYRLNRYTIIHGGRTSTNHPHQHRLIRSGRHITCRNGRVGCRQSNSPPNWKYISPNLHLTAYIETIGRHSQRKSNGQVEKDPTSKNVGMRRSRLSISDVWREFLRIRVGYGPKCTPQRRTNTVRSVLLNAASGEIGAPRRNVIGRVLWNTSEG